MNNLRNEGFASDLNILWNILSRTQSLNSPAAQRALTNMNIMLKRATEQEVQDLSEYLAKRSFVGQAKLQRGSYAKLGQLIVHLQRTGTDSDITRPMGNVVYKIFQVYKRSLPSPSPAPEEQVVKKLEKLTLKAQPDLESNDVHYTRFLCTKLVDIVASSSLIDTVFGQIEDEDDRIRCTYPLALFALYNLASSKNMPIAKIDSPLYILTAELYELFTTNKELAKTFPKTTEDVSAMLFKVLYTCHLPQDVDMKRLTEAQDATALQAMKAFLLDSCTECYQQFMQKMPYEPALEEVARDKDRTFSQAVAVAKKEERVTEDQILSVREYVADVKELINAGAVNDLFKALENDPEIAPSIITMLRDDWEKSGSLIGEAIKDNSAILTKERVSEIVRIAKEVSSTALVNDLLHEAKRKLQEDVARGRVVLLPRLANQYSAFYGLQKLKTLTAEQQALWAIEFQKIVNDAYLHQELKKKQNPQADDAYIENLILIQMGLIEEGDELAEAKVIKAQAEVEVMKRLLEGEGVAAESLDVLEDLLHKKKMEARLKAVGVNDEKAKQLAHVLPKLEKERSELALRALPWQEVLVGLPEQFPAIARKFLLSGKKEMVSDELNKLFKRHIKSLSECLQKKRWGIFDLLAFSLPPGCRDTVKDGSQFSSIDEFLLKHSAFHQNWGDRLISEMIQGMDDMDAVFHRGACLGITTRWVLNEQKYPHLTAQEFATTVGVGSITARDRFRQLCHASTKFLQQANSLVHNAWAPAFLRSEKIKNVHHLFGYTCNSSADCDTALREGLTHAADRLASSNGTIAITLNNHIIYVRIDPKRGIYRLGDVNVGILDFSQSNNPIEELYSCFKNLIETSYEENSSIDGYQFELER